MKDSKQLSRGKRDYLAEVLTDKDAPYTISTVHISAQGNDILYFTFFRCIHAISLWFTHSFCTRQNPLYTEIDLLRSQGKNLNQIESEAMARSGQVFSRPPLLGHV